MAKTCPDEPLTAKLPGLMRPGTVVGGPAPAGVRVAGREGAAGVALIPATPAPASRDVTGVSAGGGVDTVTVMPVVALTAAGGPEIVTETVAGALAARALGAALFNVANAATSSAKPNAGRKNVILMLVGCGNISSLPPPVSRYRHLAAGRPRG